MFSKLNKRVIFKKPKKTKDGRGGRTVAYQIIEEVWAGIDSIKAYELAKYQAIYPGVDTLIIIRYNPTIAPFANKCRVFYGTKYYDIKGMVNPNEAERYLEFVAVGTVDKNG